MGKRRKKSSERQLVENLDLSDSSDCSSDLIMVLQIDMD